MPDRWRRAVCRKCGEVMESLWNSWNPSAVAGRCGKKISSSERCGGDVCFMSGETKPKAAVPLEGREEDIADLFSKLDGFPEIV